MLEYSKTTIDLLRHGECEGGRIFRGSTDVKLSDVGLQNMRGQWDWLSEQEITFEQVVSSPLLRCALFAKEIAETHNLQLSFDDGFREIFFGDWEGRLIDDVRQSHANEIEGWMANPLKYYPPNSESTLDFYRRVKAAFENILKAYKGQHVLLISHGGVMRSILTDMLNMPIESMNRMHIDYAGLSRIEIFHSQKQDVVRLAFHNFIALR